jgi:hypothetical protein
MVSIEVRETSNEVVIFPPITMAEKKGESEKVPPAAPLSPTTPKRVHVAAVTSPTVDSLTTTPRANSVQKQESGVITSPSDGANPFASFPIQQLGNAAPPPHGGRRASSVSFGASGDAAAGASEGAGCVGVRKGDVSPPGGNLLPSPHSHSSHATKSNVYRVARDAYYHHFEIDSSSSSSSSSSSAASSEVPSPTKSGIVRDASGNATETVRCHQLAVASLALSYLQADLEQTKGKFPSLRVTHEDIISTLKLPLSTLAHSHFTFHELHSIIASFIAADDRFKDLYEVRAITFDTKRADIAAALTLIEEETGRRASALTATELRTTISDDGLSFHRVKIACFDLETVTSENVIEMDSIDEVDNALITSVISEGVREVGAEEFRRRPATHSGCAVIADIHRTKNNIQLLTASSVEPLKMKRTDVPLKIFHDALSVRNPASHRAQGIIEIWRKDAVVDKSAEGTMGISIGIGMDALTKVLATSVVVDMDYTAKDVRNVFGNWRRGVAWVDPRTCPLECYDYTIANYLLATATMLHLLNPQRTPSIDVNTLVTELKLPANQILLGRTLHAQQWFAMMQCLAESRNCLAEYIPFVRQVKKTGSTPYVSIEALSNLIQAVVSRTVDTTSEETDEEKKNKSDEERIESASRGLAMLVSFNGNKARQALNYVAPGENPISYAVIAGYDEENQLVLLIDCDTKRNELHWACTLDNLHSALVDHGIIILADAAKANSAETLKEILPELDAFTRAAKRIPKYVPTDLLSLGAAEALSSGTPLSLCALASTRLGAPTTLDDMIADLPCNISHALFPFMTLFDVARLFNTLSAKRGLGVIATATSLSLDRAMHRKVSHTAFATRLKAMLDDGHQVIVYYSRFLLTQAPPISESMQCPNYALVLAMPTADTVVLADTNPCQESSKFQVSVNELFKACEDVCQVSRRQKGFLCLAKDESAAATYKRANYGPFEGLHLRTLTSHAFRAVGSPQLQALAMGFTALGFPTQASQIFYCGVEHGGDAVSQQLLPMSGLRKRLTIDGLVEAANVYIKHQLSGAAEASKPAGSARNGQLTRDDAVELLKKSKLPRAAANDEKSGKNTGEVVVCVYDVRNAYDVPLEFVSAGVVAGADDAQEDVVIVEAEPSSWGEFFRAPAATAAECILRDPDDADRNKFGFVVLRKASKKSD